MHATPVLRRTLAALWLGLAISSLALVGLDHAAPALGYRLVIVGGGSMSPAIPIGSVVVEAAPAPSGVVPGDVVTMGMPNGVAITHRVVRVVDLDGAPFLETRGDANDEPDPALVPEAVVTGVVAFHLPVVGFLLAFIGSPTGAVCLASMLLALLFGMWLVDDRVRVGDALPT